MCCFLKMVIIFCLFDLRVIAADELRNFSKFDFIWNFGIALSCDKGLNHGLSDYFLRGMYPDLRDYQKIKNGDVVWVPLRFFKQFYQNIFPTMISKIVLVLSDGDESFPSDCLASGEIEKFVNHPNIIHIFTQNCDYCGGTDKVTPIPIGCDFHTMAYTKSTLWGAGCSPQEQADCFASILTTLKLTSERKKRAFVDFQLSDTPRIGNFKRYLQFGEDRTTIFKRLLSTELIDYSDRMLRVNLWKTKGLYAFSISPYGNGLDCHRTWEDLILGCIVIVKSCGIDRLYEELPIVVVKDWAEITSENMDVWLKKYGDAFTNPKYRRRLTNAYWIEKIKKIVEAYKVGLNTRSF